VGRGAQLSWLLFLLFGCIGLATDLMNVVCGMEMAEVDGRQREREREAAAGAREAEAELRAGAAAEEEEAGRAGGTGHSDAPSSFDLGSHNRHGQLQGKEPFCPPCTPLNVAVRPVIHAHRPPSAPRVSEC
jgi:hypothetical protein